ncbi:MAG: pyruvate synthase subunit beta [Calditrichaeota bacterium]|nr:pyruvate synthase subunit beta [Calditrichota bacterium]
MPNPLHTKSLGFAALNSPHEVMSTGHLACPGCGSALSLRLAVKLLAPDCAFVIPACCMAVIDGPFPFSALGVPLYHSAFPSTASIAAGVKSGFRKRGDDKTVVVGWAGDGGTFDIGLGALSASAARNDDYLYVCYDNEAYMNTGIQQSTATPLGAWTTTTPYTNPKGRPKKDILTLLRAHEIPYIASANAAYPEDFAQKFMTAKKMRGFRFIHLFCSCPPGHKSAEADAIKIARLATESRVFPLFELKKGKFRFTAIPPKTPVDEYVKLQRRFVHWGTDEIRKYQREIDKKWRELKKLQG